MYKNTKFAAIVVAMTLASACSNNDNTPDITVSDQDSGEVQNDVLDPNTDSRDIDQRIAEFLEDSNIPGISLALVSTNSGTPVYWTKGYGMANIETSTPVDESTAFWMGSVSKSVLGTLLQIANAQGIVELDKDIRSDIETESGFSINNPEDREITLRSLATHSSGIVDSDAYNCGYYVNNDDGSSISLIAALGLEPSDLGLDLTCEVSEPISLAAYLAEYLDSDGIYYDADNNFSADNEFDYSNIGAGLAGHYLEMKTGQSLHEYAASQLFTPIGMSNTGWTTESLSGTDIATNYIVDGDDVFALPHYELATYPDGGLRSSAIDMAKFLTLFMNNGRHNDAQILEASAIDDMVKPSQFNDDYGFFIDLENGIGHDGSDPGAESFMYYQPDLNAGVVFIVNGDGDNIDEVKFAELLKLLYLSAESM